MEKPDDYDARATMMWASSLSHNDLTGCGRANALPVHQLEHALSGEFDHIAHGAGLAVLFPAWGKYIYKYNIPRFAQFARNVWVVKESDDEVCTLKGIEEMAKFFKLLGMPVSLSDFGVGEEYIEELADSTTFHRTRKIKNYIPLDFEEIKEIFTICK